MRTKLKSCDPMLQHDVGATSQPHVASLGNSLEFERATTPPHTATVEGLQECLKDGNAGDVEGAPHCSVIEVYYGVTQETQLTVMCRARRFVIKVLPENLRQSMDSKNPSDHEIKYLQLLQAMMDDGEQACIEDSTTTQPKTTVSDKNGVHTRSDDEITISNELLVREVEHQSCEKADDESPYPEEAFSDWVLPAMREAFNTDAPRLPSEQQNCTLLEYFRPPTFFYILVSRDGALMPLRTDEEKGYSDSMIPYVKIPSHVIRENIPTVCPEDVTTTWDPERDDHPNPAKAFMNGTELCHLKRSLHSSESVVTRELEILLRLRDTGLDQVLRVPSLRGYVKFEGETRISGFLISYIDTRGTLDEVLFFDEPPLDLRLKWERQIDETVMKMHAVDIIWGDVKADNILIDKEDNAWIIDFGGSCTPGWVDRDKMESLEGDLQGLAQIKRHLRLPPDE